MSRSTTIALKGQNMGRLVLPFQGVWVWTLTNPGRRCALPWADLLRPYRPRPSRAPREPDQANLMTAVSSIANTINQTSTIHPDGGLRPGAQPAQAGEAGFAGSAQA